MPFRQPFLLYFIFQWTWINLALSQSTQVLHPGKIKVRKGTRSTQDPNVLQTNELTDTQEDASTYIEFRPSSTKNHASVLKFLPSSLDGTKVSDLSFMVNMRGPSKDEQKWIFKLRNFQTKKWEKLFTNKKGVSGKWYIKQKSMTTAAGVFSDYQHPDTGQIWVNVLSNNKVDNLDLDYVALSLTLEETPLLSPGASWTYDIGGYHGPTYQTSVVMIDLFDTSDTVISALKSEGRVVSCYFSAGTFEEWREDADQFDQSILGLPMAEWEGERWLDIRSDLTFDIMNTRMATAQQKGCQALEPDNVDGYINNTGFDLTKSDQISYLMKLSQAARNFGLLIGLKNADDLVAELEPFFDFSIAEECYKYKECCDYYPFIENSKPVFAIEYTEKDETICDEFESRSYSLLFGNYELSQLSFCSPGTSTMDHDQDAFDGC